MNPHTAIKTDLFAADAHRQKIDTLGDPLSEIESCIDFAALAREVDRVAPHPVSPQGGRSPNPTETMVRIHAQLCIVLSVFCRCLQCGGRRLVAPQLPAQQAARW